MNHKLKALGIAFLATLAMSAVAASVAQATGTFTASGYPAVAKGSLQTSEGQLGYIELTDGNKIECTTTTFQATLTGASHQLTVTPHFSGCKAQPVNLNVAISLNGCDFLFTATGTSGAPPHTTGSWGIFCPAEKRIEVNVGGGICKVDIGSQQGLAGVTYTNKGGSTVTIDVDSTNQIKYTDTDTSIFCPFAGNSENANGDAFWSMTLHGFQDTGAPISGPTGAGTTYSTGNPMDFHVK